MLTHRVCGGFLAMLLVIGCLLPVHAIAHPMGNFSINHFSALDVFPHAIRVTYILDMAEIPTFQEMQESGVVAQADDPSAVRYRERKVQEWQRGLRLRLGETPLTLNPRSSELTFPPGAGGLPTLRLVVVYEAPMETSAGTLVYEDMNYPQRVGWKEIVARAHDGVTLHHSSVPVESRSQQLTNYATDLLQAPPQEVRAEIPFTIASIMSPQSASPVPQAAGESVSVVHAQTPRSRLTELMTVPQLTPGLIFLSLLIAMGFGALHALEPGHGKTLVAAYLVGERGTAWHALILGLTVTASHTIGVFALGAVALFASHYIVPEQLYPWLSLISGLLIVGMGGVLLRQACLRYLGLALHHHHPHDHIHPHRHEHHPSHADADHSHVHDHYAPHRHPQHDHTEGHVSYGTLLTLGITGGMIPCPGALVVLLSAVALQRITFGLLLIVAFSVGLAAVLVGVGLLLVSAQHLAQRWGGEGRWTAYVPFLTPLVMTPIGVVLVVRALLDTGLFPLKPF